MLDCTRSDVIEDEGQVVDGLIRTVSAVEGAQETRPGNVNEQGGLDVPPVAAPGKHVSQIPTDDIRTTGEHGVGPIETADIQHNVFGEERDQAQRSLCCRRLASSGDPRLSLAAPLGLG